ncbi:glycoside hydrolase family 3 C-terminal domain-containing protein [Sphingomonas sp. RHCKR47]|uniref:glycoside hydrolase family 3 N-terminal domain-containing protein n=1 Tax=Sphingomonas citricola TaxID=2862498 RepID=UPI001CA4BD6D|nr:glycoside hydrolase family 3 N-terminal domain-containing protein [Sphingomonas citricola]MBW6523571.1 glycoside hydrolase family 3 C-terminal domain-containing protein [Sphingomonas citricola]
MRVGRRDVMKASALLAASAWAPVAIARDTRDHGVRIRDLLSRMTLSEKIGQMNQIAGGRQKALNSRLDAAMLDRVRRGEMGSFLHVAGAEPLRRLQKIAVEESRLGIPLLFAMDVIHGYRTTLPVPLALAAGWDPAMMERAAALMAEEAWAAGLHWTFTPMVDVARDPRWGRVVEGAGEDAYLGSRMAEAQVRGLEGPVRRAREPLARGRVLSCSKHFVGYGAVAGGRDYDSADVSERTLHEVYLPPFHAAMRAGSGSFMTAFNDVAGVPMTANEALVRGKLRERWGYQGLVVSDWNAIPELISHGVAATPAEAAALALHAGVDMDMASSTYADHLATAVAADASLVPLIDQAVMRILMTKARLGLFDDPYRFGDAAREKAPLARGTARELATRSIVLLRNEGAVLPLKPTARIALIGALADDASSELGSWRARGQAEDAVTLRRALPQAVYDPGTDPAAAARVAANADVVLLVIGEDYDMTGEARSRSDIGLPGDQQALTEAVRGAGKPIVAIVMGGRPLALEHALTGIPAVLQTWFLGIEGGPAIADVLMGKVSPAGRLPIAMPRTTGQVPMTYAHVPTGRPANPDLAVDSARYHDTDIGPVFAFGHGLSYTRFGYAPLTIEPRGDATVIGVVVSNDGAVAGDEVVQLYIRDPVASVARPVAELRGFKRVTLAPGERRTVRFTLAHAQLALWKAGAWMIEAGTIEVMVGSSSADIRQRGRFTVGAGQGSDPAASIATRVEVA